MHWRFYLVFLFIVLLYITLPMTATAEELGGAAPLDLSAGELLYERETETWRARGAARLQKGDLTLLAEQVQWNAETGDASARGEVLLTDPQAVVTGEELQLNTETGRGLLRNGEIVVREQNYHIAGAEIERLSEERYRILDGTFTTCDAEPPAWEFAADRLDVTMGGWAKARHVRFYLKGVPVLYLPFFAYPVKSERESGFLPPSAGSSSRRGTQLSLAWYQVIDRNQDATFYLDYLSKLGIGKGLEYRYIFDLEDEGVLNAYHVNGLQGNEDRYALDWEHAGTLPGEVRLTADVEYVSSRDYYEDFGVLAEEYSKEEVESVIALSRHWRRSSLTGQLKYTKDLEESNDATLQKLPEVVFSTVPSRVGESPFFLALDAASTYFWRHEGVKGERLTVRPELSAVFHPGDILEIRPAVGYRERLYWTSDEGPGFEREGIADFSTRVSSRFSRIFALADGPVRKLRHSIEPEVTYRYVPSEDQSHLPQFDSLDDIGPENRLLYAVVNRLVGRLESGPGDPVYHEYLYLRFSQEYDIRESRRDLLDPDDDRQPFADLRTELILRPNFWSYLDLDFRYDVNAGSDFLDRFPLFAARAGAFDQRGNAVAVDYRYQQSEDIAAEDISYLSGNIDLAWFRPVYLNYLHRHDLDNGTALEKVLNLEYRAQCWSVMLTLRDRPEDTEFLISFTLSGIGRTPAFGGSLGGGE